MSSFGWQQHNLDASLGGNASEFPWQIRVATVHDAELLSNFIIPLVQQFIVSSCRAEGAALLLNSLSPTAMAGYLQQDYRFQLAFKDGTLMGVVGLRERRHLFHLFIAANAQRTGLGQKMWYLAWRQAIADGSDGHFTVNSAVHAVEFYKKLGFAATEGPRDRAGVVDIPMVGYFPAIK
ncbi:MAG: GNAT family N-acetyltransferase [Rheinheimera sp.]|nr:GNAT family N-acetyltransferase [Rheinheimera sp.]